MEAFTPGTLESKLIRASDRATRSGHLESIPTELYTFDRDGVRFVIRMASELLRKKKTATRSDRNPFLPYDEEMFVCSAGETHVCLLNKFNVVDHHLLIVTRAFEHQRTLLTEGDFVALRRCLDEIDGLAFYNGGRVAGASQPHKHLQLVPRVTPDRDEPPIEQVCAALGEAAIDPVGVFPFVHAGSRACDFETYRALMSLLEHDPRIGPASIVEQEDEPLAGAQAFPYNLLATRRWMLIVPRTSEGACGIQINALGYAGSFLAKTEEERALIEADPYRLLAGAGIPT